MSYLDEGYLRRSWSARWRAGLLFYLVHRMLHKPQPGSDRQHLGGRAGEAEIPRPDRSRAFLSASLVVIPHAS
jgi:hypothetical protein